MNKIRWRARASLAVVALLLAVQAGCDSVVDPGDHAEGVVLIQSDGSEAARFVYSPRAVTGNLTVPVGESATYQVRVLTEAGAVVDLDGGEYSIANPGVVNPVHAGVTLDGDDEIVLNGLTWGDTSLYLTLKHGAHTEFQVVDIPVVVEGSY